VGQLFSSKVFDSGLAWKKGMLIDTQERDLAKAVAESLHADQFIDAANQISDYCKLNLKIDKDSTAITVLQHYLHQLMTSGGMEEAAQLLWTPTQFNPEPKFTRELWKLFEETNMGLIMGSASAGKSFGIGVRIFLEWVRDPEWTTVQVIGPSEDHLERNLFSHLVSLHKTAKLPMPGEVGELFIGLDRRNQLSSIKGIVIPVGNRKKAGRLQGGKRRPRPKPHPIFGPLSRLFIFIDEIENVPGGLWTDIDNVLANVAEEGDIDGFKIFGAYNPTNQHDEVGKRAEPIPGWETFDIDKHFRWKSKRDWQVLRLDGEKSENVIAGKMIYPGLQTRAGLDKIARNAGGKESPGYYSMGRGAYPPAGISFAIIPPGMIAKIRGEYIWYDAPQPVGACDIALEGGDAAIYTLGRWGKVTGIKYPPSIQFPNGQTVMFKDKFSAVSPRWGLQIDQQFTFEKGDTVKMKDNIINFSKRAGVRPHFLCVDHTGHGRGVGDLIKNEWSSAIQAINYSDGATPDKLMQEDTETCDKRYDRVQSELWFALRAFAEFGYVLISPAIDLSALSPQLTQRHSRPAGKREKVESKKDYIDRTGQGSPNEADSVTLLVHAVRKGSGFIPSMRGDNMAGEESEDDDMLSWRYPHGVRIDVSNQADCLDDRGVA
jgi:hypothetical protein